MYNLSEASRERISDFFNEIMKPEMIFSGLKDGVDDSSIYKEINDTFGIDRKEIVDYIVLGNCNDWSEKYSEWLNEKIEDELSSIIIKVYRVNYLGEYVICGRIQEERLYLRKSLKKKYNMPNYNKSIPFKDIDELVHLIYFDKEEDKYLLKFFHQKER